MTTGVIASWKKKEGDALNPGDCIAEIETDKATVDFECQDSGYLAKILVPSGSGDVAVGRMVAIMVETKEAVAAFANLTADQLLGNAPAPAAAPAAAPTPVAQPVAAPAAPPAPSTAPAPAASAASSGRIVASPLAKKLAKDSGVALNALRGTGPDGRIIAADVKEAIAAGFTAAKTAAPVSAQAATPVAAAPTAAPSGWVAGRGEGAGGFVDIPHTQMRRVIAQRLTASKQQVPHYTLTIDVNLEAVLALRAQLNESLPADQKLSVNDLLIKASALALRKVPEVNSSWLDHGIRAYDYVDVSVAVALPDGAGLVTPIVKDADTKGLTGIASNVRALVEKAKNKKLAPEDYQGGTFTISNLGMFGIRQFSAIINPPQACILAVGAAERRVVPDTASDAKLPYKQAVMMSATLSCDHRVVDGAVGAQWLAAFKALLEQPHTMLL